MPLHETAFAAVSMMSVVWFTVTAWEYDCQDVVILSAACVVALPVLSFFGPGLAQKGLILYSLFSSNVLYYAYLDAQERQRW